MTAPLALHLTRPPRAAVARLRPAPSLEPPVERIRPTRHHLRVVHPPVELPFGDDPAPALVAPLPARVDIPDEKDDPFGPLPTSRSELPDPAGHARNLVVAALEVLGGRRPLQQLMPHLGGTAYQNVARQLATSLRPGHDSQDQAVPSPTGAARNRLGIGIPRVCEPADGVAEMSLVVRWGGRVRAVAMRLEGIDGRWRCTVLHVI